MIARTPRASARLAFALVAALSLAGCGGGGDGGGGGGGGDDGTDAAATPAGEEITEAPAGGPETGDIPTIADALYTGGTTHFEVSGDKSLTVDAPLVPGASITTGGLTMLYYLIGEGEEGITLNVQIAQDSGAAISLTSKTVFAAGGQTEGCRFEFTRNDASGLSGTFACSSLPGLGLGGYIVDVNGTFSADR
jgi:hypothetical protein